MSGDQAKLARRDKPTSTIQRAFQVLNVFDFDNRRLTLSEIARRSEIPVPTTYRILQSLEAAGAVQRDRENRYAVGMTIWRQGVLSPVHDIISRGLRPTFLRLATSFNVVARAFMLCDKGALCIEEVLPTGGNSPEIGLGATLSLDTSTSGIVLRMLLEEKGDITPVPQHSEHKAHIESAMNRARTQDHLVSKYPDGTTEIAVPMRVVGRPPMALSIRSLRTNDREITWKDSNLSLRAAAKYLAQKLALSENEELV